MLPYRKHGSKELAEGYATAAKLAEERQRFCEEAGDCAEAKQWGKIARYCSTMARFRLLDEPNPRVQYEVPMDPDTIQVLIAKQAVEEDAWYREWDGRSVPPDDPKRPMAPERRYVLAAALQVLTAQERVAAIMFWGWRLDPGLISEVLEIKPDALRRTLARCKRKFKRVECEDRYLESLLNRTAKLNGIYH